MAKKGRLKYPLRKIVRRFDQGGVTYEELECGHAILPRSDFYGETNADRRRCIYCRKQNERGEK